ncbi:heavy-metal-associated domain-containing protein [Aquimarina agarilytica]|uniref:heavy-metal-associated domain-containing protein n=1 Tax=Aquimarina agarilytica TaxID=1087449 RepID=UPI000289CB4B|nr:cation transporter [Aquimarina agarilytica]
MKKIINSLLISLLVVITATAQKSMDEFQIQVDGLGCPFCAYGLEKKFKEFKGIKKVQIEIQTGDFKFEYPTEKQLTMDAVVNQVKKAGYTPKTAKITRSNGAVETLEVPVNSNADSDQLITETVHVKGNCQMCKARIESAALSTKGVQKAFWNVETKMLEVAFDRQQISVKKIAKNIALAGHDAAKITAPKEVYEALPVCCYYNNPNLKSH